MTPAFEAALLEFRAAFAIAVGDQSPFAKIALEKFDAAIAQERQLQGEPVYQIKAKDTGWGDVTRIQYEKMNQAIEQDNQPGIKHLETRILWTSPQA